MNYPLLKNIILLLILSVSSPLISQNKYNFNQFSDEAADLINQPFQWNSQDYLKLGLILGSTYGLMHLDEPVREIMIKDTSWAGSIPLEFGRYWGEQYITLALGIGFLVHGISKGNRPNKKLGFEIVQSFIYSVALNTSLKIVIGRSRPYTNEGAFNFYPLQKLDNSYWSLPSGHTTIAFSLSTVLAENIKSDFLKGAVFIPALLTAFSRVNYDKHWISDVFLGGLSGYFVAKFITDLHQKKSNTPVEPAGTTPLFNISLVF